MLLLKNPQFLLNHYETWSKLATQTHESVNQMPEYELDCVKIVNSLLLAYF